MCRESTFFQIKKIKKGKNKLKLLLELIKKDLKKSSPCLNADN